MFDYGFEEGKDFISFLGESNGGRSELIDYVFKLMLTNKSYLC